MPLRMQAELSTLLFLTQLFVSFTQAISVCLCFSRKNKTTKWSYALQNKTRHVDESTHRLKCCLFAEQAFQLRAGKLIFSFIVLKTWQFSKEKLTFETAKGKEKTKTKKQTNHPELITSTQNSRQLKAYLYIRQKNPTSRNKFRLEVKLPYKPLKIGSSTTRGTNLTDSSPKLLTKHSMLGSFLMKSEVQQSWHSNAVTSGLISQHVLTQQKHF